MLVVLNIESMFKQVHNWNKDNFRKLKLLHGYLQLRYVVHSEDNLSSYDKPLHICFFSINDPIRISWSNDRSVNKNCPGELQSFSYIESTNDN